MMRLILLVSTLLLATMPASHARLTRIWSYNDLAKEADVVMIVSVSSVSERTGTKEDFHGQPFDSVLTKFKVHSVLKGKYDATSFDLHHVAYPTDTCVIANGWVFQWFDKPDEFFLVFLKSATSGALEPVSGQEDLKWSFGSLSPDFPTRIRSSAQPDGGPNSRPAGARGSP
jgi:hypothetical protein